MIVYNSLNKIRIIVASLLMTVILISCEDFMQPESQDILLDKDAFTEWSEYRAANMGLYALQQDLIEQIVVLGELRADLLTTTRNKDVDLYEIENFSVSPGNKYASPVKFYKLISNCNRLIERLISFKPDIIEEGVSTINQYDRLYGEVVCMRSWAYFNLGRIYNEVPVYFNEIEERESLVDVPFWPFEQLTDTLINQLENIKVVGVDYSSDDQSWERTSWSEYSRKYLLGQIYLSRDELENARSNFDNLILDGISSDDGPYFQVDNTFSNSAWANIFESIDLREDIFTVPFSKNNNQQNEFQKLFNLDYFLKPSSVANYYWNTQWRRGWESAIDLDDRMEFFRVDPRKAISTSFNANDTLVTKFTGDDVYASDQPFVLFRASAAHLYMTEIYLHTAKSILADQLLNGGPGPVGIDRYQYYDGNIGIRYRQNLEKKVPIFPFHPVYDPYTHELINTIAMSTQLATTMREDFIMEERALELAFEGERFYDLVRVAKRRNDPSYLADKIAAKFSSEKKEQIRALLMDENNWYLDFPK